MKINEVPDQEYLSECFEYEADTGILIWKIRPESHFVTYSKWRRHNSLIAGTEAGSLNKHGYVVIRLTWKGEHRLYPAHRLVMALHGNLSDCIIDHINGNRSDNRIENLRYCDQSKNIASSKITKRKGLKGAFYDKIRGKWLAQIKRNYKSIYLGRFDTEEEAHAVYMVERDKRI